LNATQRLKAINKKERGGRNPPEESSPSITKSVSAQLSDKTKGKNRKKPATSEGADTLGEHLSQQRGKDQVSPKRERGVKSTWNSTFTPSGQWGENKGKNRRGREEQETAYQVNGGH